MYTCELCGKQVKKGYLIVDLIHKLEKPYVVCSKCGESIRIDKEKNYYTLQN